MRASGVLRVCAAAALAGFCAANGPCHDADQAACAAEAACKWTGTCEERSLEELCRTAPANASSQACAGQHGCLWQNASCVKNVTGWCTAQQAAAGCVAGDLCYWTARGCEAVAEPPHDEHIDHEEFCERKDIRSCVKQEGVCKWRHGKCVAIEHEDDEDEALMHWGLYIITVLVIAAFLGVRVVQKLNSQFLSESGGVIITGVLIGLIVFLIGKATGSDYDALIEFDEEAFVFFILPPIIFEAGFTLEHTGVMRNLGTILLYAVIGTLISSLAIGLGVYGISSFCFEALWTHPGAPFISLAFGALLSAVDPVAVIAVLGQKFDLANPPLLYNLVFGEAVLNDAVSIVLYNVMVKFVKEEMTPVGLLSAVGQFLMISSVSCVIGYAYGAAAALVLKHVDFKHHPSVEIILIGAFGMGSYYLAEVLHMSGIMSLFLCARILGHHAMFNLSQEAREMSVFVFKTLAHLAETYVFVLLGEAFFAHSHSWGYAVFIVLTYFVMLVARALNIFPLSFLANLNRKRQPVTFAMQFFMWFSGLRGAIAFGLALLTLSKAEAYRGTEPDRVITVEIARVFVSTTLVMVTLTVLVMGGFTEMLLNRLGLLADGAKKDQPAITDRELALISNAERDEGDEEFAYRPQDSGPAGGAGGEGEAKRSKAFMRRVAALDEHYVAPFLRSEVFHVSHVHDHEAGRKPPPNGAPLAAAASGAPGAPQVMSDNTLTYSPPQSPLAAPPAVVEEEDPVVSQTAE